MPRRKTKAQTAILKLLQEESNALSHDGITAKLDSEIDRVTIYRILNRFVEDGVVHRIVGDDGRQYFATSWEGDDHTHDDHQHLHFRCVVCNRVECVPGEVDYKLPEGYKVDKFNVILSGCCNECKTS